MDHGERYLHRDYFRSPDFQQQLNQFAAYLNMFEPNAITKHAAKSSLTVSVSEIMDYRNQSVPLAEQTSAIRDEYESLIQAALADENNSVADFYKAQRNSKLDEAMKIFRDNDYVIALLLKEKEQRLDAYYEEREGYRAEFVRHQEWFDYYFRNPSTGKVYSNLNVADQQTEQDQRNSNNYAYATNYTMNSEHAMQYAYGLNELIRAPKTTYEGWIAVPNDSMLVEEARSYIQAQWMLIAYGLAGIALLVVCFTRFKGVLSKQAETSKLLVYYGKLPLDMKMLLIAGTAALTLGFLMNASFLYPSIRGNTLLYGGKLMVSLIIAAVSLAITLLQWQFLVSKLRDWSLFKTEWTRSLLYRGSARIKHDFVQAMNHLKESFIYQSTGTRLFVFAAILIGMGFIGGWATLSYFQYNDDSFMLLVPISAAVTVAVILISARRLGYLNRLAQAAEELAAGRMPNDLPKIGQGVLPSLASHINAWRSGVKVLQHEQAKSERLKTELITNVSHDLRTPLTSIITYAGLLQSGVASTVEEHTAYIEIINQKSKRLKTMIDDLFEVSTMASGNAKLYMEELDLVQLMQQALAEYKDEMDNSEIQFRITLPEEPLIVLVDGQKLWRAFDNLIGNMLKYSLSHTRAYISMQISERQDVVITFKNVSKFEISENVEELFERFKRGDTSRHTEGSGLGLAIAQSIIELHEGRLTLETDGDLFKASITLKTFDSE